MNTLIRGTNSRCAHKKAALAILALEWAARIVEADGDLPDVYSDMYWASMRSAMRTACKGPSI